MVKKIIWLGFILSFAATTMISTSTVAQTEQNSIILPQPNPNDKETISLDFNDYSTDFDFSYALNLEMNHFEATKAIENFLSEKVEDVEKNFKSKMYVVNNERTYLVSFVAVKNTRDSKYRSIEAKIISREEEDVFPPKMYNYGFRVQCWNDSSESRWGTERC